MTDDRSYGPDIVERLEHYAVRAMPHYPNDLCSEAKREIARLRAEVDKARSSPESGLATPDDLRAVYEAFCVSNPDAKWMSPTACMIRAILNRYDVFPKGRPDHAQSPGLPVAWRWQAKGWGGYWIYNPSADWRELHKDDDKLVFEPLYAVSPDTSTDLACK